MTFETMFGDVAERIENRHGVAGLTWDYTGNDIGGDIPSQRGWHVNPNPALGAAWVGRYVCVFGDLPAVESVLQHRVRKGIFAHDIWNASAGRAGWAPMHQHRYLLRHLERTPAGFVSAAIALPEAWTAELRAFGASRGATGLSFGRPEGDWGMWVIDSLYAA